MQKRYLMLAAVLVVGVGLDQWTKVWAEAELATRAHPMALHIIDDDGGKPLLEVVVTRTSLDEQTAKDVLRPGRTTRLDPRFGGIRPPGDAPAFTVTQTKEGVTVVRSYFWVFHHKSFDASPRLLPYPRHLEAHKGKTIAEYLPVAFPSLTDDERAELLAEWTFSEISTPVTAYEPVKPGSTYLIRDRRVGLIDDLLQLTYAENPGAAWGFLGTADDTFRRIFFLIVSIVAVAVIGTLFHRLRDDQRLPAWGFAVILSGAVGNFIDRVRYNYVIDFVDFYVPSWGDWHYPTFNVADVAITAGVALLLLELAIHKESAFMSGSKPTPTPTEEQPA